MRSARLFLLLSVQRTEQAREYVRAEDGANCCIWWRPNAAGYTHNLADAGRYTLAEVKRYADPPYHVAIPLYLVTVPASAAKRLVRQAIHDGAGKLGKYSLAPKGPQGPIDELDDPAPGCAFTASGPDGGDQ